MELGVIQLLLFMSLAGSMSEQIKLQIIVKPNSMNPSGKNHFASSRHHQ